MTQYKRVTLNHALLKKPVYILLGTIAGYHYSDASKAVHVYTTAGVFPVNETEQAIGQLIDEAAATIASTTKIVATRAGDCAPTKEP